VLDNKLVGAVGGGLLSGIRTAGYNLILLFRAASYTGSVFARSSEVLRQMWVTGAASLPVTLLVALFSGMVLALQTGMELMRWGIQEKIGTIVTASMTREMGPIWTGIVLAARVGSGMAAEIGTMQVSEEIDALEVMSIDPARFLVMPRLVALVIMAPILTIYANIVVFALIIVTVGCAQGMRASGGAVGVGRATRNTVVISLILIIAFNYFVTSFARWIP
jgi:phospholipid/cholesterol/gamma-HCH transport system permease protein